MVVILNNGPISGACYQHPLITPSGPCQFAAAPPAFSNSATTLCCLHCCRPLTVHLRVGLLGCSPYRQHQHSTTSPCGSFLACIPCGRRFDTAARQNSWLGSSIFLNWNNQLLLRFTFFIVVLYYDFCSITQYTHHSGFQTKSWPLYYRTCYSCNVTLMSELILRILPCSEIIIHIFPLQKYNNNSKGSTMVHFFIQ
jgi:hypothetical protein